MGVKLPKEWKELPFFCLPDGAHKNEEDFVWFHLPPVAQWPEYSKGSFFGISCYRQIASEVIFFFYSLFLFFFFLLIKLYIYNISNFKYI